MILICSFSLAQETSIRGNWKINLEEFQNFAKVSSMRSHVPLQSQIPYVEPNKKKAPKK